MGGKGKTRLVNFHFSENESLFFLNKNKTA